MSLGTILQTILAVIFIYLILSLITSEIQEEIASISEFRAKRLKESIKQLLGEDSLIIENGSAYISGFWDAKKEKFQEPSRDFNSLKDGDYFYFEDDNDYNNLQNPQKIITSNSSNVKDYLFTIGSDKSLLKNQKFYLEKKREAIAIDNNETEIFQENGKSYIWLGVDDRKIVPKDLVNIENKTLKNDSDKKVEKQNIFTNNSGEDIEQGDKLYLLEKQKKLGYDLIKNPDDNLDYTTIKIVNSKNVFEFKQRASKVKEKQVKSLTELLYEKSLIHSLNQSSTSILSLVGFSQKRPGLPWIVRGAVTLTFLTIFLSILFTDSTRWTIIIAVVLIIFVLIGIINLGLSLSSPQPKNWSELKQNLSALRKTRKSKGPSYIEPKLFSKALLEVIQDNLEGKHKLKKSDLIASSKTNSNSDKNLSVVDKLNKIEFYSSAISRLIQIAESLILEEDNPNLSHFKTKLEKLFEETQKRSSGVYTRNAKGLSFVLGFLIAMIANADGFYIVSNLSKDNNNFSNLVVNKIAENKSTLFPDKDQANAQYGLNDEKEELIIKILNEVGTLPLGWNFDRELETQNLKSLIEILDKKTKEPICFDEDSYQEKKLTDKDKKQTNKECFEQFLEDIEQNPHLGSYVKEDTNAEQFIKDLSQVENCLKEPGNQEVGECLQKEKYDFSQLKKYYDSSATQNDTTNQELIESLKPFEVCLNKDDSKKIGECLQGYNFPTTYGEYRQHLKNRRLSQRIDNIETPNKIDVANQVRKQGGLGRVIIGWVVSAFAISMGAPFWFDLLGKVMNVRNARKPIAGKTNAEKTNETQEKK